MWRCVLVLKILFGTSAHARVHSYSPKEFRRWCLKKLLHLPTLVYTIEISPQHVSLVSSKLTSTSCQLQKIPTNLRSAPKAFKKLAEEVSLGYVSHVLHLPAPEEGK